MPFASAFPAANTGAAALRPSTGRLIAIFAHAGHNTMRNEKATNVTTPQTQTWIAVGELADAFAPDANTLPLVDDLAGKQLTLHDESGGETLLRFDHATVVVETTGHASFTGDILVTSPRPDIYLVDVRDTATPRRSLVLVLDLAAAAATIVEATLPEPDAVEEPLFRRARRGVSLTAVAGVSRAATIDGPFDPAAPVHVPTADLVGLRLRHRYNAAEYYEHVYLNEGRYCWHCLEGSEKGLADVDECEFRKIAAGLYLFSWREKLIPTFGLVLMDLDALRTTGKIMGFTDDSFQTVSHFAVGARSTIVNRVPDGV